MVNVDVCENPYVLNILLFVEQIIKIMYYLIPIGLILFLSIDFVKAVIVGDENISKEFNFSVKRIINLVGLFLVPTFVGVLMQFINDLNITTGDYAACLRNTSSVSDYTSKYDALVKVEEEKKQAEYNKQMEEWEYWKKMRDNRSSRVKSQTISDDGSGVFVGQTYDLTDAQVKRLTAVCIGEKGQNVKAVAAEATMMANIYEDRGNKVYKLYDWVLLPREANGWYASSSRDPSLLKAVTDELFNAVKDVLVNGNRTLPLYVDDHDCLFCGGTCKDEWHNKGDVCYLDTEGKIFHTKEDLYDRYNTSIYKRGVTKVYTIHKASNSNPSEKYFIFYTFISDNSGPIGYTEHSYKRING